jgi:beta-glucanase (GH16 family)
MFKHHSAITYLALTLLLLGIITSCKKTDETIPSLLLAETISIEEGNNGNQLVKIQVALSSKSSSNVVLTYSTTDGTAIAGEDYLAVEEAQLIIESGQTESFIELTFIGDNVYETDEYFQIIVNGLTNAKLEQSQMRVFILNDDLFIPKILFPERSFFVEGNDGSKTIDIAIGLSGPSEETVQLKWETVENTARAAEDFEAMMDQTLTFLPGETQKTIQLSLLGDDIFEMDDVIEIHFDEVQFASLENPFTKVIILNDDSYLPETAEDGTITPDQYPLFDLVWSDEFNTAEINTNNWGYNTGAGGWGNNELQTYITSSQNSFVENGKLHIKATKSNDNYFSARLITQGKQEFTYGRIDIRAKLPYGQGIWPALWMLGANFPQVGWPRCGEIDIMEYLGHEQSKVHGTVHYFNSGHRSKTDHYILGGGQSFHDAFHVFTIVWQENAIRWYVDYELFHEVKDTEIAYEAFTKPQFFIFNLAVGGNWPGYPNATTVFPQEMIVDYVRVFQSNNP